MLRPPNISMETEKKTMHYMNGREAHNGDKIVHIRPYDRCPTAGVLYNATPGNDYCNGLLAPFGGGSHICPNLKECIHLEDFGQALLGQLPGTWPLPTTEPGKVEAY